MKLVTSVTTPFGRKIRIMLAEKSILCDVLEDIPWNPDSRTTQFNPLGKVPVLVLDDGETLFDSPVIADYLDTLPGPTLIPASPAARVRVKRWEALADGISEAAANIFIERKRPSTQQSPEWIARQRGKIEAALNDAEQRLSGDWCEGNDFTLADAAFVAALGYLQLRFGDEIPLAPWPALTRYITRLNQRPSVLATLATI